MPFLQPREYYNMAFFGSRMRIYSVLLNPEEKNSLEQAHFIPEGFCWYAFLFSGFWAGSHHAWKLAALCFLCVPFGEVMGYAFGFHPMSIIMINLGFRMLLGMMGYDWLRQYYQNKGWIVSDVIVAYSELEAMHRYYDRHMPSSALMAGGRV
ncbi:MAG: DUF2628 domain-containing protein [Alphaproteobacteria bacterium]|nr:MAG: DUF2628 domain-containing protein [Alphaproteobacteria bacterium]TAF16083.1 MAG: DUF2628 domain-containing protein [Alphaproteobacteria bacterium]TAF39647.1 MAG: DUF2628 domain-containing protein [Alphaproteobacteria bacterium]TAF75909.1 MAG: DUF2628 domain-containing protein [Alphaproteobacteria bacterium]